MHSLKSNRVRKVLFISFILAVIIVAYYPLRYALSGRQIVGTSFSDPYSSINSYYGFVNSSENGITIANYANGNSSATWKIDPFPQTLFLTENESGERTNAETSVSILLNNLELFASPQNLTVLAHSDTLDGWSMSYGSGVLAVDQLEKQEGTASIRMTLSQLGDGWVSSQFNPSGIWNLSSYAFIHLWLRGDINLSQTWVAIQDASGNWGRWEVTLNADNSWTQLDLPLSHFDEHGNGTDTTANPSAPEPDLSKIDSISVGAHFLSANSSIWVDEISAANYRDFQAQILLNNVDVRNLSLQGNQNASYASLEVPFDTGMLKPTNFVTISIDGGGFLNVQSVYLNYNILMNDSDPLWRSFVPELALAFILEIVVASYLLYKVYKWVLSASNAFPKNDKGSK